MQRAPSVTSQYSGYAGSRYIEPHTHLFWKTLCNDTIPEYLDWQRAQVVWNRAFSTLNGSGCRRSFEFFPKAFEFLNRKSSQCNNYFCQSVTVATPEVRQPRLLLRWICVKGPTPPLEGGTGETMVEATRSTMVATAVRWAAAGMEDSVEAVEATEEVGTIPPCPKHLSNHLSFDLWKSELSFLLLWKMWPMEIVRNS